MAFHRGRGAALGAICALCVLATPAITAADPAKAAGLVRRVAGTVTVEMPGTSGEVAAIDLVQFATGERYKLSPGATIELIYFANGRRESWTGPASFIAGSAGGTALAGATARVSFLPANAVTALRRVGLRKKVSRRTAVGGVRVRGLRPVGGAPAAPSAAKDSTFDQSAAQRAIDRAMAASGGKPGRAGQRTPRRKAKKLTLAALTGRSGKTKRMNPKQARHDRFMGLSQAGSNPKPLVALTLLRVPTPMRNPVANQPKSTSPGQPALVAQNGELLAFEVANLTSTPLHYVILELGPGPADGVVLPAAGKSAILAPFERRRLPNTFAASPPLGSYRYRIVATTSAARWWEPAPLKPTAAASEAPDISALLRTLWHGSRPGAAHRWRTGKRWGTAAVDLKLIAAIR